MTRKALRIVAALATLCAVGPPAGWAHGERGAEGTRAAAAAKSAATEAAPAAPATDVPSSGRLYEPPAPGTYELPPIERVSDRSLLGPDGKPARLLGIQPDDAAVVSFIYRSCTDATGCPLALATMQRLDRALAAHPDLARRVHLVTVSFDPAHDTPARMKELRGNMDPKCDWRFLTARDRKELAPLLEDFGQTLTAMVDEGGEETGVIRHVLKVYLVDGKRDVRNIYSTGFLDERLLLNDLQTILE